MVQPMPYVALQQMLDAGNPHGVREYFKVDWVNEMPDEAIDQIVEQAEKLPAPFGQLILAPQAGAMSRSNGDMALNTPDAPLGVLLPGDVDGPGGGRPEPRMGTRLRAAMKPYEVGTPYPNFIAADEGRRG